VLRPEDITDQEVRGFDDGEVLQRVHNVDQMLRNVEFQRVYTPSELARLKQFIEDSKKPLYPDCQKYSRLSGDLKLLQLKADHGWSNKSFKHLLDVLRDMLPEGNQIAESVYEVNKIICSLGKEVEKIHACKNSCVLFCGDYADVDKCLKCGYDRYKRKKDGGDDNNADDENEPGMTKAQLLHWHDEGRKELNYKKDGKFRHPVDAAQWGNINTHFPWYDNARSIRFAMSTDGMNPFGNQRSTHSTWPVVLSLYNLPPWLCRKQKYMMLTILVSGTKQPSDRIDVYLTPLVDDLKILWKPGVQEVWDEYKHEEFTMHGMLFITINDNPAHRNLSGQNKRKGEAYPHSLEDTCAIWLRHSKKYVFMGHRRFLGKKHPYQAMDCQFNGEKENREASMPVQRSGPLESQGHQNYRGVTQTD
jgi:hypothetical protein